ncbi:ER degradation-enhancing alpha-mannosidase-like protein 2 [Varroa jacobsoni]|uniref:alpha-1,2-Mannosidase n=1 Tax=Varroa destructor TaxID=109461 RepID=A0A7M7M887_VARDE|nr:ER degradation-enhancing alpha-mannosidase-like protein 2 [Varroa destructor]XP_022693247.1 ER degradation-enhancing alpha-mannosidase-like protein 2 [Varroa jacobsoni]
MWRFSLDTAFAKPSHWFAASGREPDIILAKRLLRIHGFVLPVIFVSILLSDEVCAVSRKQLDDYRERVRTTFTHAYDSYMRHAFPLDELRPLSCDGFNTWGSNSLTLIDALDTLVVMGNYSEFRRAAKLVLENTDFDKDLNVSVFETNIRVVGGLISAHLLSKKAGMDLEQGWPCEGPFLRLAVDVAKRLLPAFDTATGMPYGTVNLREGVPVGETTVTCTAGVGTFIVEFASLTRLTGDPRYEEVAVRALRALWATRSKVDLVGNHLDIENGKWTATDASIGAGVDSYFEYLAKGAFILRESWLLHHLEVYRAAINKYMRRDDWFLSVRMQTGEPTMPYFQSLESFWPGTLSLLGYIEDARRSLYNYHQVWKQLGFIPEFYDISRTQPQDKRESYPLRPEFIESVMYLYQSTKDPHFLQIGVDVLTSIEYSARTECGYATVKNVATHLLENRMESFFLAETTKYLYLLFDVDNFVHNPFANYDSRNVTTRDGLTRECIFDAGGYIFNTEAHLVDLALLDCCRPDYLAYDIQARSAKAFLAASRTTTKDAPGSANTLKERQRMLDTFTEIPTSVNDSTANELALQCFRGPLHGAHHSNIHNQNSSYYAKFAHRSGEAPAKNYDALENRDDFQEWFSCTALPTLSQFALRGHIVDSVG